MSSLKKFDYRIKDNRKRNIFLCGIFLIVVTIIGVKLFNSYASFSNETNELTMVNAKTKVYPTAVAKITELEKTNTNSELRYDGTTDNNLRYIGKNPSNYVKFNDELWRIIGVMNNVEDGSGNKDTRVKLIKAEGIGQISWDNRCDNVKSETETNHCISTPDYYNNWEEAKLQKLLNGPYLNSRKSEEYNRWTEELSGFYDRKYEKIDFTKTGIKEKYRDMIDAVKYNLGGPSIVSSENNYGRNLTPTLFYEVERSDNAYNGNPSTWTGYIGLMYPSDYGFATSGGEGFETESEKTYISSLEKCMSTNSVFGLAGCRDNDWLFLGEGVHQWTMISYTTNNKWPVCLIDNGYLSTCDSYKSYLVNPVLYLKPNIKITGGTGTKDDPFTLAI